MKDFIYGTAYYPELWDDETIEQDIKHMKILNINTVRINEFAWSFLEPKQGKFDFERLKSIIEKLHNNNINVILCTPTATPPNWIPFKHKSTLAKDAVGRLNYGARQHICTNNEFFRKRAAKIVNELAKECGKLPGVIAWQIDNEFKCNAGECYCDSCKKQWHKWLASKYKTIENLNNSWCTGVWSHRFNNFNQVPTPERTTCCHSPSLLTNYRLFTREKMTEFMKMQVDIIKKWSALPITHNSAVYFDVDNNEMIKALDFASFDDYPLESNYRQLIFDFDRFRCLDKNGRFMCMETSPGYNGEIRQNAVAHRHGFVPSEVSSALIHGSMGFSFWHFRQHRSGCEFPHGSMLNACGQPTACYKDVLTASNLIQKHIESVKKTELKAAEIAIHYCDKARAFMMTEHYNLMDYNNLLRRFYDILLDNGYSRDILPMGRSCEQYKLVFTPFAYYIEDNEINNMLNYVLKGGVWVVGPMTAIRTKDHNARTDTICDSRILSAAGVTAEYFVQTSGTDMTFNYNGKTSSIDFWALLFGCGNYEGDYPLVTGMNYGKGKIFMLGALPSDNSLLESLITEIVCKAGVSEPYKADSGVVAVIRKTIDEKELVMAVDMCGKGGTVKYKNITFEVKPFDCAEKLVD